MPVVERGLGSGLSLPPDRYNTPIEDLNLSVRAYNCLKRSGLMTVGQVLEKSEEELLGLRNFGRKSYDELRDKLIELGYIEPTAEGLTPVQGGPGRAPQQAQPARRSIRTSSVILDEEDEEQSLGALGKALKEALKEAGDEDLIGADDED
jgi:DNA-directed RNA polymerase subunit alpha